MPNTNLAFIENENTTHRLFSENQLKHIDNLPIPTLVRFMLADRFETKFINSSSNIWDFIYSGRKEYLNFKEDNYLDDYEVNLLKYFLIYYIQLNTPAYLSRYFKQVRAIFIKIREKHKPFNYETFEEILLSFVNDETQHRTYYTIKNFVRLLIIENFEGFTEENENELEVLARPLNFNSKFYYQENEDVISKPLVTLIQNGFAKLNAEIIQGKFITDDAIKNTSILGLIYVTGMRPVQMAKLSVEDIKADTYSDKGEYLRYSILVPYAKQGRYTHSKIAIKLPEEIATILFQYIKQFELSQSHPLFDLNNNAATYCSNAINEQLFEFSPKEYQRQVIARELIHVKYTSSQFRHHVAYSMALGGASAEDIAYILGHSSIVTARHYIYSSPNLAQIRALALGRNPLYQQMIAMLMTGDIITPEKTMGKNVVGFVNNKIHSHIGQCGYKNNCFLEPVRSCYGCVYFHPYLNGKHSDVLESIQQEIESIVYISDSTYNSSNPVISIHESTKFEIESVIRRCELNKEVNDATS